MCLPTTTKNSNNYLRATQQGSMMQFQATQDVASGLAGSKQAPGAYNWLTQSSMDTLQSSLFSGTLAETQSALLFSNSGRKATNHAANANRSSKDASSSTSSSANGGHSQSSGDIDRDVYRLRRRFVKDLSTTAQSRFFARKQVGILDFFFACSRMDGGLI